MCLLRTPIPDPPYDELTGVLRSEFIYPWSHFESIRVKNSSPVPQLLFSSSCVKIESLLSGILSGFVPTEATGLVSKTWGASRWDLNWMLRCTLLESLARRLILGRSHDKSNHLCLRMLKPLIWVTLRSQMRNVEREGRRASVMLPHKVPRDSTALQRSPWVQRWGQLRGTCVLTAWLRSGLPTCHLPSSTPLYFTGRS